MNQENKLLTYIDEFCDVKYRYEPSSESEVFTVNELDVPIVFSCIADAIGSYELNSYIKVEVVPTEGDGVEIWISNTT